MIPTRIIEKPEFEKLMEEAGAEDLIVLFALFAYDYGYTSPDEEGQEFLTARRDTPIGLVFANVVEPLIYRDEDAKLIIIVANQYNSWNYDEVRDLHRNRTADFYVIAPWGWDMSDLDHDLDIADFFFKPKELPKLDMDNLAPVDERRETH